MPEQSLSSLVQLNFPLYKRAFAARLVDSSSVKKTPVATRKYSAAFLYAMMLMTLICYSSLASAYENSILVADDKSSEESNISSQTAPNQRLDFSATYLNGLDSNSLDAMVTYTHTVNTDTNLSLAVPYKDPNLSESGDNGFGDIIGIYSFVPSLIIDASPWVPATLGSGIAVLAPTGSTAEGRSLDSWVFVPFFGYAVTLTDDIFIAPQVSYVHSVDEVITGGKLRLLSAEIGVTYVNFYGFWASYFPELTKDLEANEWSMNHRVSLGTMLTKHSGISVDFTRVERFHFGSPTPKQTGFDEQIDINIHFTF